MEDLQSTLLKDSKRQENRRKSPLHVKEADQGKPAIILTFWAEYSDRSKWAFRISKRSLNDLKLVSLEISRKVLPYDYS